MPISPELRRTGIGASEIAAVCGLDPWKSPWRVYADKMGLVPEPASLAMRRGQQMERIVADIYAEESGRPIVWLGETMKSPDPKKPWQLATPDFGHKDAASQGGEVKYPRFRSPERWGAPGSDQVPENYICQTNWQMAVTGWDSVVIVAMFGGQEIVPYVVDRDSELIAMMEERAGKFWRDHIEAEIPPAVDGSSEAREYLIGKFPRPEEDMRGATSEEQVIVQEYHFLKRLEEKSGKRLSELRNSLLAAIGPAKGLIGREFKLTCNSVKGSTYTVVRPETRQIRVKWLGEEEDANGKTLQGNSERIGTGV